MTNEMINGVRNAYTLIRVGCSTLEYEEKDNINNTRMLVKAWLHFIYLKFYLLYKYVLQNILHLKFLSARNLYPSIIYYFYPVIKIPPGLLGIELLVTLAVFWTLANVGGGTAIVLYFPLPRHRCGILICKLLE